MGGSAGCFEWWSLERRLQGEGSTKVVVNGDCTQLKKGEESWNNWKINPVDESKLRTSNSIFSFLNFLVWWIWMSKYGHIYLPMPVVRIVYVGIFPCVLLFFVVLCVGNSHHPKLLIGTFTNLCLDGKVNFLIYLTNFIP